MVYAFLAFQGSILPQQFDCIDRLVADMDLEELEKCFKRNSGFLELPSEVLRTGSRTGSRTRSRTRSESRSGSGSRSNPGPLTFNPTVSKGFDTGQSHTKYKELLRSKLRYPRLSSKVECSFFGRLKQAARKILRSLRSKMEEHRSHGSHGSHRSCKLSETTMTSPVSDSKTRENVLLEFDSYANIRNRQSNSKKSERLLGSISTDDQASSMAGTCTVGRQKSRRAQALVMETTTELEETLKKLAKYGEQLQNAITISPIMLRQIASASSVLLRVCDEDMMEHLVDQGLLKQMVDTELIRKTLDFFHMWLSLDVSSAPRTCASEVPLVVFSPGKSG